MAQFLSPIRGGGSGRLQGSVSGGAMPSAAPDLGFQQQLAGTVQGLENLGAWQQHQQELAGKLQELQARKLKAYEDTLVAKRVAVANEQLSQLRFQIPNDPSVHPLARREAFNQGTAQLLNQVGQGLTEESANEAYAHLQAKATALANTLDAEGTGAFVQRENEALEAELSTYARAFVHSETPEEQRLTLNNVGMSLQKRVGAGIITEEKAQQLTEDFYDNANAVAVETAINRAPEDFFDHLTSLLDGGPGMPGMPIPVDINKAYDKTQAEIREINGMADREEVRAEKLEEKAREANAFGLYAEALEKRTDTAALTDMFHKTREAVRTEQISPSEGNRIITSINGMKEEIATGGVPDDIEMVTQFRDMADYDPDAAIKFARSQEGKTLKFATVNTLIGQANNMKQEGHISKHPQIRAAEDAIEGAFAPTSMFADMMDAAQLNRIKTEAISDFRQTIWPLAGPAGIVIQPALDAVFDVRDKIIESRTKQMATFSPGDAMAPAAPVTRDIPDLMSMAMRLANSGQNPAQVDAWARNELMRHFLSQGGDPTDRVAYDAWAAQVLQGIRERQQGGNATAPKQ